MKDIYGGEPAVAQANAEVTVEEEAAVEGAAEAVEDAAKAAEEEAKAANEATAEPVRAEAEPPAAEESAAPDPRELLTDVYS